MELTCDIEFGTSAASAAGAFTRIRLTPPPTTPALVSISSLEGRTRSRQWTSTPHRWPPSGACVVSSCTWVRERTIDHEVESNTRRDKFESHDRQHSRSVIMEDTLRLTGIFHDWKEIFGRAGHCCPLDRSGHRASWIPESFACPQPRPAQATSSRTQWPPSWWKCRVPAARPHAFA